MLASEADRIVSVELAVTKVLSVGKRAEGLFCPLDLTKLFMGYLTRQLIGRFS